MANVANYDFPLYRKLNNGRSFYKIISPIHCLEIQLVGKCRFTYEHTAQHYPEKVWLLDLIQMSHQGVEPCAAELFEQLWQDGG